MSTHPDVQTQTAAMSRRGVLFGGAALGAATAVPAAVLTGPDAEAAYLPRVRPYIRTPLPTAAVRHMANRFSYGYTPALRAQMNAAGGPRAWFERQLTPVKVPDAFGSGLDDWFPVLHHTAAQHAALEGRDSTHSYKVQTAIGRLALVKRMHSNRQVLEIMSEFWSNHFTVFAYTDLVYMWHYHYDRNVIRRHALGRFSDMLQAAIVHPAMLFYLDADLSRAFRKTTNAGAEITTERLNENLGRELLELHTVGAGAGYTEEEVKDSARLLTGYGLGRFDDWVYRYDPEWHVTGPVKVMGFSHANASLDGRPALRAYLAYLAHHPRTAQRIARKLAERFVSDHPSPQLVSHLAGVFTRSGTDIRATLRALVSHPEFHASAGAKVRTSTDDVAATVRALGATTRRPTATVDATMQLYYQCKDMGQMPFGWPRPDGFPTANDAWSSAARMMASFRMHYTIAGHWWPSTGMAYRPHAAWLPQRSIRFDAFVDHLCRVLHGRPSTSRLLGAASLAVGILPATVITKDHQLIRWQMPHLLGILLDTPQHLTR